MSWESVNGGNPVPNLFGVSRRDPFEAIVWTVNSIYERGFDLRMNEYVVTGSFTEPKNFENGERAKEAYPGTGELEVEFV